MCAEGCAKLVLILFNSVFLVAGLALLAVGGLAFMKKDEYEPVVGEAMLPVITYSMLGAGVVVILVAFAGCVGAITKSRKLLGVYLVFLVIVFCVEAAIGIIGFLYFDRVKLMLDTHLKPAILTKYGQDDYKSVTNAIDTLQPKLKCCGYMSPTDWLASHEWQTGTTVVSQLSKFPMSCCINKELMCTHSYANAYPTGCYLLVEQLIETNLLLVAGVCLGVCLVELMGIVCTIVLCKQSKEDEFDL